MSDFDPRFDAAFQRGYDAPERPAAALPATPEPAAVTVVALEEHPDAEQGNRGANPFLVALTAVGVAMIAGGLLIAANLGNIFNSTQFNSETDYVRLQIVMVGTPILICLGLATLVGVVFVFAVRWRR